jgi:hypothetical protein
MELIATSKSNYRKEGTIYECEDSIAVKIIKKGFAVESGTNENKKQKTKKK